MDRRCCYQGRLCNSKVVEHDGRVTGFCSLHILNSRFAAELGYKQCHFENSKRKNKKCHRPVRSTKQGENTFCGRHQKREKIERDPLDETNNKVKLVEVKPQYYTKPATMIAFYPNPVIGWDRAWAGVVAYACPGAPKSIRIGVSASPKKRLLVWVLLPAK